MGTGRNERTRGRPRQRGGWMSGVWREESSQKQENEKHVYCFFCHAHGEAMWPQTEVRRRDINKDCERDGNALLYRHEKERTRPRLGKKAACALGRCDPATPGVKLECSLKRVPECSIKPSRPLFRERTVGMMGMGKQQDNCVWTADTAEHHTCVMFFWQPSSDGRAGEPWKLNCD